MALINDIKKANLMALKEKDNAKRVAYSEIIARYGVLMTSGKGAEVTDADVIKIIMKIDKELDEEIASFEAAHRDDKVAELKAQKAALKDFLPTLLSEEEIRKIIDGLPDKALPAVMKHFKENYAGKVDMGLVSKIARG